jgi:hypothetical protein
VNANNCFNTSSQIVVTASQPTLNISATDLAVCAGQSSTLSVNGANTYTWTSGPSASVYPVTPASQTTYTVIGTNTTSSCTATATISVDVYTPSLTITGNTVVCDGMSTTLTASSANAYTWNPGGLPFATYPVTPASTTIFTVNAVGISSGGLNCPISGTVQVTVNPNPTITATSSRSVICKNEIATITAGGASSYTFIPQSGTPEAASSITVTSSNVTALIYTVSGVATNGCAGSTIISLNVNSCNGIEQTLASEKALVIYPNPSTGQFSLSSEGQDLNLTLINCTGQVINNIQLNSNNNHTATVRDIPGGVYFILGNGLSKKVIVNN